MDCLLVCVLHYYIYILGCTYKQSLYISGGHNNVEHTNQVLMLQSKEDAWKPVAPMLQSRSYHSMVAMGDKIYVVGGCKKVGDEIKDLYVSYQTFICHIIIFVSMFSFLFFLSLVCFQKKLSYCNS